MAKPGERTRANDDEIGGSGCGDLFDDLGRPPLAGLQPQAPRRDAEPGGECLQIGVGVPRRPPDMFVDHRRLDADLQHLRLRRRGEDVQQGDLGIVEKAQIQRGAHGSMRSVGQIAGDDHPSIRTRHGLLDHEQRASRRTQQTLQTGCDQHVADRTWPMRPGQHEIRSMPLRNPRDGLVQLALADKRFDLCAGGLPRQPRPRELDLRLAGPGGDDMHEHDVTLVRRGQRQRSFDRRPALVLEIAADEKCGHRPGSSIILANGRSGLGKCVLSIKTIKSLGRPLAKSARDLAPIVLVLAVFQLVVVGAAPDDLGHMLLGLVLLLFGLTFLVRGLQMSLFPLGEALAGSIARRGSLPLLLAFGFLIGFGSTIAEPALGVLAGKAAAAAAEAGHLDTPQAGRFAGQLRIGVATAVGAGVVLGLLRLLRRWSIGLLVLGGYAIAAAIATLPDNPLIGVAFDAAAAATAVINIPLIAALGVGLAGVLGDRDPLADGFGMVALATVMPMLTVLVGGWLLVLV